MKNLNVLIECDNYGGHYPLKLGWANALKYCGHEVMFWHTAQPNHPPLFDVFHEFRPDIFYSNTYTITKDTIKVLQRYPETRVILFASANGPAAKEFGPEFEIVRAQPKEIALVEEMKKLTGQPDYVWIHHYNNWRVDYTLSGWGDIGCQWYGIPNAADVMLFYKGKFDPALKSDCSMCGSYWPYKGRNINRFIFPLSSEKINMKIFGYGKWPIPQYLGTLEDHRLKDLFVSTTVGMSVSEPHSTDARDLAGNIIGGDVIERPFKVLAAGGFVVHDHVNSLVEDFYPLGGIPTAKTPKEFRDTVLHFINHPDDRLPYMKLGQEQTFAHHTYFDRVAFALDKLGLSDEAGGIIEGKNRFFLENPL